MFASKPRKLALTLFCSLALVLAFSSVAQADAPASHNVARDHVLLSRMIKKRAPQLPSLGFPGTNGAAAAPPELPPINIGEDPNVGSVIESATSQSSAFSESQSSASSTAFSTSTSSSTSETSAASSSVPSSASSSAPSSASTDSSTASSAPSSAAPSTPATDQPAPAPTQDQQQDQQQQQQDSGAPTPTASGKGSANPNHTVTGYVTAAAQTSGAVVSSGVTTASKTAITILAVIAGSIAAVFIGWTIIRKWKFKPSTSFEDRMAPIDWHPEEQHDDLPGSLRRNVSTASHGSFHSSSAHDDDPYARSTNGTSNYGSTGASLQPLPDHDFTAGNATLAPVGGYADLSRGPSPGPQMSQYGGYGAGGARY